MDQENWELILAYLSAQENPDKKQKINEWLAKDPLHQQQLDQAMWLWKETASAPKNEEWKESFQTIQNVIQSTNLQPAISGGQSEDFQSGQLPTASLQSAQSPASYTAKKTTRLWPVAAFSSAAALLICALFIFLYKNQTPVQLSAVTWVSKTAVPGKILDVLLPDSTEIWLNSGSTISYPQNLKHAALRTVKLKGEAFFKVKRDPRHPFVVHSLNLQTRVLGTSFNIRDWAGHNAEVTVLTGKVAVSKGAAGSSSAAIHLLPGQKALYEVNSSRLSLQNADEAALATSWITGKMVFEQAPLKEVFETISRRYAVQLIAADSYKDCKLTANFNNVSLTEVLKTLRMTLGIQYTINQNTIHIKGGTCN